MNFDTMCDMMANIKCFKYFVFAWPLTGNQKYNYTCKTTSTSNLNLHCLLLKMDLLYVISTLSTIAKFFNNGCNFNHEGIHNPFFGQKTRHVIYIHFHLSLRHKTLLKC